MEKENEISKIIVESSLEIHKNLGPGLLESAYEKCLVHELRTQGLLVESQKIIPINYKGVNIDAGFRADIIVENLVLIEAKAVEALNRFHLAQVLTYLKLSNLKLGLLINFNEILMKHGLKRVVL